MNKWADLTGGNIEINYVHRARGWVGEKGQKKIFRRRVSRYVLEKKNILLIKYIQHYLKISIIYARFTNDKYNDHICVCVHTCTYYLQFLLQ